jgi:hypothetical protein
MKTNGAEHPVYQFKSKPDGLYPVAGLIDVNGMLYGTDLRPRRPCWATLTRADVVVYPHLRPGAQEKAVEGIGEAIAAAPARPAAGPGK